MTTEHNNAARGRIGTLLAGTWRIERRLGAGGMATVYAARHDRNGGRVAVKVLHADSSRDPRVVRRFLREGYLANKVTHSGVVRVYDDGVTDDGCAYLIMDLLAGETLEEWRVSRGGCLGVDEALTVVHHVLQILGAAHDHGITHRDVKPDNVFLTTTGDVRLLDFGIAGVARSTPSSLQTATGVGWGTPRFMAPEQLTGVACCGPRVDVWAVGVMFYTLLTGRDLFEAQSVMALLVAHQAPRAALEVLVPGLAPSVAQVFERALCFDAKDRWSDARAMARALEAAEGADERQSATMILATVPRIAIGASGPAEVVDVELLDAPAPDTVRTADRPSFPAERPSTPVERPSIPTAPRLHPAQAATNPRRPVAPSLVDGRRAVIGVLLLSIATFVSSVAYSVRVSASAPTVTVTK